jgi:general secretion pathway protein D
MVRYVIVLMVLINIVWAHKCENKLFTFTNTQNSQSLNSFLKALAVDSCGLNIVYQDDLVRRRLEQLKLDKISIKDYTLKQFLDLIIASNNLFYEIDGNNLEISYIKTKIFNIDYIPSTRTGSSTFQASSSQNTGDVNSVDSKYEFNFWDTLSTNLNNILNTVDTYRAKSPIIDKNSGLITITATKRQLDRIEKYINKLNERLHKQIIIDVKIYSVELTKAHQTGINWSNLNFSIGAANTPATTKITTNNVFGSQSVFNNAVFNVSGLLNFLATQGNVNSISNPKIATINNQKAIISVGDTINYRYPTKVVVDQNGNPQTEYAVENKFVGILLDITPEISEDGTIMLRINPTISAFRDETQLTDPNRQLAPDTTDNKMSTVVRIKDGQTLILGGLITDRNSFSENGVPVLKEIPVIKYLFSAKSEISQRRELVFIITPHILDFNKKRTLQDLGF